MESKLTLQRVNINEMEQKDAEMQTRCKDRNRTLTDTSLEAFPTNKRLLFTCTSQGIDIRARVSEC
jgi:hypothetical protein